MSLYQIDQELQTLMEAIDQETGEWVGDPEAWERLNLERDRKIESTALYIKDLRAEAAAIKGEIDTFQRRMKTIQSKEAWLLENLRRSLDGQNFETARCQLRFKRNPESVRLTDEAEAMQWAMEYAPDCLRYKPATLSLSELKAEMKKGAVIPGAELVRETRLEVR